MPDQIRTANATARVTNNSGRVRLTLTDARTAAGIDLEPDQARRLAELLAAHATIAEHE